MFKRRPGLEDKVDVLDGHEGLHHGVDARARASDDLGTDPGRGLERGYDVRWDVLVLRRVHLVLGWEVDPALKPVERATGMIPALVVDDAARGGHPLAIARSQDTAVAHGVSVRALALLQVHHRVEPAMGMPRGARELPLGVLDRSELVEQEKRVRHAVEEVGPPDGAPDDEAGALLLGVRLELLDQPHRG